MLIIGGTGSGKTKALLNLIKGQDSDNFIGKIYELRLNGTKISVFN